MKSVLVTGANGYIGRHVVDALLKKEVEVVALDYREGKPQKNVHWIEADLFDPTVDILSQTGMPDACIHLAWRNGFDHQATSHLGDLSHHYLFLCHLLEKGISQLAVMGTMHEVGYWEGCLPEDAPCNPLSNYAIAKDALRRALFNEAKQTTTTIQWLRGFYIYGDDSMSQSIFGKLIRAAQQGDKQFPFTSGKNCYDFIEARQLASQIASTILQQRVDGIINCCSGKPVSLADKVESFIKDQGLTIELLYGAFPDRTYDSPALWGDATKINTICAESLS